MSPTAIPTDRDPLADLRRHVDELVTGWTDRDGDTYPGLIACITQHLTPVRLADSGGNAKGQAHSRITGSPAPWEAETGEWLADVHHGARRLEAELRHLAWGTDLRDRRGSSLRNTATCLHHLTRLVALLWERDGEPGERAAATARTIARWHQDGLLILGARRRSTEIRWADEQLREDGTTATITRTGVCPHCGTSVRVQPTLIDDGDPERHLDRRVTLVRHDRAVAICPRYNCRDAEGARHTWRVDRRLGLLLRGDTPDTAIRQEAS